MREWLILLFGLGGVMALGLPFAYGKSPLAALALQDLARDGIRPLAVFVPFFLAPLISLGQLWRCVKRPLPTLMLGIVRVGAILSLAATTFYLLSYFKDSMTGSYTPLGIESLKMAVGALGLVATAMIFQRVRETRPGDAWECMMMGAYICGTGLMAVGLSGHLGSGAMVVAATWVVHAISCGLRVRYLPSQPSRRMS
jgi:hypothetical protein